MAGKVIVADDSKVARESYADGISIFGVEVDQAKDGRDLVEKVRNGQYDIVFTDYEMPNMDGMEATRQIRKFSDVPIYMNSGCERDGIAEEALEAGVTGFTKKDEIIERALDYFEDILKSHSLA